MSTTHNNQPHPSERKGSALRVVAHLAWVLGAGSILAPSLLDLSASGKVAANVLSGIAFFVFFLCAVTGFVRVAKHQRNQASTTLPEPPKRSDKST
jgi:hypothetical protein